jgi:hypothetical protein
MSGVAGLWGRRAAEPGSQRKNDQGDEGSRHDASSIAMNGIGFARLTPPLACIGACPKLAASKQRTA